MFALAYAQSPLFTSNQNQYFLHGLARAGWGYLRDDWLANTLDPTPVFSALIEWSYRLSGWPPIYYLYFVALAGVYLFSAMSIAGQVFIPPWQKATRWIFLAAFIGTHAAALRAVLVRLLGSEWAYLLDGGVAGQRLLGDVFQPSMFGVLLLLSSALFLRRKYVGAALALALAATFHPTYLFSGAMITLTYMGLIWREEGDLRRALGIGLLTLAAVLPTALYAYLIFRPSSAMTLARARELMVTFRIPHHALPSNWADATTLVKTGLILAAIGVTRRGRLFWLLTIPFALGATLTLAQIATGSYSLALLFPWRISAWLVPLALTALLGWAVQRIEARYALWLANHETGIRRGAVALIALLALGGALIFGVNLKQKNENPAQTMMDFVRQNRAPGQVYVIPLDMQDFRLETGVPVYVEFKSIPYRDVEVLEWFRRVSLVGQLYRAEISRYACQTLDELAAEGVTHVVLPYDHTARACPQLERLFIKFEAYEVFALIPR